MKRNMICIICPRGCAMSVEKQAENLVVTGNGCPKGQEYAHNECTNPLRTVTATVRVANRRDVMVSVKTATPVPKGAMMEVMQALRNTCVNAPVHIGDLILHNVCGTDIVATKSVD